MCVLCIIYKNHTDNIMPSTFYSLIIPGYICFSNIIQTSNLVFEFLILNGTMEGFLLAVVHFVFVETGVVVLTVVELAESVEAPD